MYIPDKDQFQPSNDSLNLWLGTRKKTKTLAGNNIKPLFTDTDYDNDNLWYWIAWGLEILGLIATLYGGFRSGGIFAIIAVGVVFLFMFVDFFWIAPQLHRNVVRNTYNAALIQVKNKNTDRQDIRNKQDELTEGKAYNVFLVSFLILMAVLKTLAIVLLGAFDSMILYIGFFIIFLIIVYAHIYKTRYRIAYKKTADHIKDDYNKYKNLNKDFEAKINRKRISSKIKLNDIPIVHNNHKIVLKKEEEENGLFHYQLETIGVLTDDELFQLTTGQEDNNQLKIFVAGRKLQLESFGLGGSSVGNKNLGSELGDIENDNTIISVSDEDDNGELTN